MIRTIPALFDDAVQAAGDAVWLRHEDSQLTYGEAATRIAGVAAALRERGIGKGDMVLATTRNTPDHLFLWLATVRLGAVIVTVNPASTPAELEGFIRQVEPKLIVTDSEIDDLQGLGDVDAPAPNLRPEDPAVLIPTSGTTGRSKLVVQTHRAYVLAGEGFPWWLGLTSDDRLMTSLPLFHLNAPAYSMLGSVAARAGFVLLPRFSASGFLDAARRHGATEFNAIGAMLEILMRQPERPDDADNPLRLCYFGPSPTRERHLEIERRFGIEIVCGYALSESPYGLIWRRGTRPYGTLGSPRQHPVLGEINQARVRDDGELELRSPAVMLGYYRMPEETAEVLVDGWLRTGDLVHDNGDGTYTFIARRKEVIRRRGENLAPGEVEAALESHPDVVEAAVIGVPSELTEEEVKAFIVIRDGADVAPAALREWASERLARFKLPRFIELVTELPHTDTRRIAKHRLPRERTPDEWDAEKETPAGRPDG